MKKISLIFLTLGLSIASFGQNRCHTNEYVEHLVHANPELKVKMAEQASEYKAHSHQHSHLKQASAAEDLVYIPVVFHVVHRNNIQNILDARIIEQMERLNEDYSATNADTSIVPAEFKPFISDTKIRFVLATVDPDGNPTTGITRTETTNYSFSITDDDIKYTSMGGKDAWDTDEYLNIWVGNISAGILGYAMPPFNAGNSNDGVVIGYRYVGNNSSGQYDRGRTATHEVGHYLGLEHVWGQGGCSSDDGINDTPNQYGPHYGGAPSQPIVSCGSNDMYTNYMDYGDDEILVMFTTDQKTKMEYSLDIIRNGLATAEPVGLEENTPDLISLYPNPSSDIINVTFKNEVSNGQLNLIDVTGRVYYSQNVTNSDQLTVDVSNLVQGLYFVQFSNNNQFTQQKIVIQ